MKRKFLLLIPGTAVFLIACGGLSLIVSPTPTIAPTSTATPSPSPTQGSTVTPILFPTSTSTILPTETPLLSPTLTSTLTLEPQWVRQGPNEVIVPILLYHHVGYSLQDETVYYISPEAFDQQMNLLYQWGYKTISVELLVRAIKEGADLPPKPVILTFDDGSETTYTTALPIMQRYGFVGAAYIIHNYIGIPRYMNADQIRALHAAGWEIGSHGLNHVDLTIKTDRQDHEILKSRSRLQALLGLPVLSFAYPFGAYDSTSLEYVHQAGYTSAMGLGNETLQGNKNLFYLYRQSVEGTDSLQTFASLLPWREDQYDVPALTIVP